MNNLVFLGTDDGFVNLFHIVSVEHGANNKYIIRTVNNSIHTVEKQTFDNVFLNMNEEGECCEFKKSAN